MQDWQVPRRVEWFGDGFAASCTCTLHRQGTTATMISRQRLLLLAVASFVGLTALYHTHRISKEAGRVYLAAFVTSSPFASAKRAMGVADPSQEEVRERMDQIVARIKSVLPAKFDPRYTNPCWNAKNSPLLDLGSHPRPIRLACLPKFFLIGYPKCGTTQLYNLLTLHPQFAHPLRKELHWWTRPRNFTSDMAAAHSVLEYVFLMQTAARKMLNTRRTDLITGDLSASTAWRLPFGMGFNSSQPESMPYLLSRVFPNAKYIVIMRDPVEHIYSRFWYSCQVSKVMDKGEILLHHGPWIFEQMVYVDVHQMKQCIQEHDAYKCSYDPSLRRRYSVPPVVSEDEKSIIDSRECGYIQFADSIYYITLKEWLKLIPLDKFLFLRTEDLASDPVSTAQRVFKFLELEELESNHLQASIATLGKSNEQDYIHEGNLTITPKARSILNEFLEPFNQELAKLLHDDQFLWKDIL